MMWWLLLMLAQDVHAQDPRAQAERVRAAMQASIQKQMESVKVQREATAAAMPKAVPGPVSSSAFTVPPPVFACEPVPQPELTQMIDSVAQEHGIEPKLVREVARQESAFRPCAVSPKGAQGLMQLMPATQAQFNVSNPFDPKQSLEGGAKLLKQLLAAYGGDLSLALSAYNAGAARVDQANGIPNIPETQSYVSDILGRLLQ